MPPINETPQEPAVNNVWGQSNLNTKVFLTMPSGQTCWARVIGLQGVLESGVMGEADSLTAFVGREYIRKVRGAKGRPDTEEIDPDKLMKDPAILQKIVKMVDGLMPHVVADPPVACHYSKVPLADGGETTAMIPQEDRLPGVIYTDMIGLEDKMFLFNFAMSAVKDAETFRQQSQSAMGNVADGQDVPSQAQHPGGSRAQRRQRPPRRR